MENLEGDRWEWEERRQRSKEKEEGVKGEGIELGKGEEGVEEEMQKRVVKESREG